MPRQFGRSPLGAFLPVPEIGSGGGARLFGDTASRRGWWLRKAGRAFPFGSMPLAFCRLPVGRGLATPKNQNKKGTPMLDQIHPHAAGIDVGSTKIFVALPGEPPSCFETFTAGLEAARDHLRARAVTTVAM